jgi:hypothetical protein
MVDWEATLSYKFPPDNLDNVDIVVGLIQSKFSGRITKATLDGAVALSFRSLKYVPGFEHPVIKQELAKAAADRAQQQKDANELERKRQREAEIKAGIQPRQSQIRTEFDRDERSQKRDKDAKEAAEKAALKQVEDAAREQVEEIRSDYMVSTPYGKVDWARTSERRELLKATIARRNGKVSWVDTLKLLRDCLRGFEIEDSKRGG